jgi:uncharacterized protein YhaN
MAATAAASPGPSAIPVSTPTLRMGAPGPATAVPSTLPRIGREPAQLRYGPSTGPYEALAKSQETRIAALQAELAEERQMQAVRMHAHDKLKTALAHERMAHKRAQREAARALDAIQHAHRAAALAARDAFWDERRACQAQKADADKLRADIRRLDVGLAKWMDNSDSLKYQLDRSRDEVSHYKELACVEEDAREEAQSELQAQVEQNTKLKVAPEPHLAACTSILILTTIDNST